MSQQAEPEVQGVPVTAGNWQDPPVNRWAFWHVGEILPTYRVSRGAGPARDLPPSPAAKGTAVEDGAADHSAADHSAADHSAADHSAADHSAADTVPPTTVPPTTVPRTVPPMTVPRTVPRATVPPVTCSRSP